MHADANLRSEIHFPVKVVLNCTLLSHYAI